MYLFLVRAADGETFGTSFWCELPTERRGVPVFSCELPMVEGGKGVEDVLEWGMRDGLIPDFSSDDAVDVGWEYVAVAVAARFRRLMENALWPPAFLARTTLRRNVR